MQRICAVIGDQSEKTLEFRVAQHISDVQTGFQNGRGMQFISGYHDIDDNILAEADLHSSPINLGTRVATMLERLPKQAWRWIISV